MKEVIVKEENSIEDMIYEVRGKQVMIDSDLAKLYECKNGTKEINQAVKNNSDKFPERYCFRITEEEYNSLKSKSLTSKGGSRKGHTVFTEQGVAMLATILKSNVATMVSIRIMDTFVAMRHYIGNNEYRLINVEGKIIEHDERIKMLEKTFDKFDEKKKNNEIYFNGQTYDAYSRITDIINEAKKQIIIIDRYADKNILDMISKVNAKVILITKENGKLSKLDIDKYNSQYDNLNIKYDDSFHDRYIIVDNETFYHLGASINHAGNRTFSINILSDEFVTNNLLNKIKEIIN